MMKKDLTYYLSLNYPIIIEKYIEYDGKEYFEAELPELPGCSAQGKSVDEAIKNLEEAKKAWIEVSLEEGLDIPEPASESDFSSKILLRIPPKLHKNLVKKAKEFRMSLNQYIRTLLENSLFWDYVIKEIKALRQDINLLKQDINQLNNNFLYNLKIAFNTTEFEDSYTDDYKKAA